MSRGPNRDLSPLELDGIRYEQIVMEQSSPMERRSGFMRAVEMASGKVLWEIQVYKVSRDVPLTDDGEEMLDPHMLDCFFLRFKFMPDKIHILVENEIRERYFVNIQTQVVQEAKDSDFPPEMIFKPIRPASEILPLVHRGILYMQDMSGFYNGTGKNTGRLNRYDVNTHKFLGSTQIYEIPFNDDLEGFTSECYFATMCFEPPGKRDIYIMNQRLEHYFYNIRTQQVYQLKDGEIYRNVRYRIWHRAIYLLQDIFDFVTFRDYKMRKKYSGFN